jgi:glutaryl-CoA dehydrogenase
MPAIKFRGVDFIQFDSLLSDEERLVRDTARQFIEDNLIPIIEECNRAGRFPRELVKPMADLGFFGASLKGYGCAEMSNVEYGLMNQELERGDSGVRSFVSVQSGLCMYPIYEFGSEEQKHKWLPAMQKGEKLGCFGLTEPDFGSNPGGMRTRARKVGKEYVINGEKITEPAREAARLDRDLREIPGVVGTGLFVAMADIVLVAESGGAIRTLRRR